MVRASIKGFRKIKPPAQRLAVLRNLVSDLVKVGSLAYRAPARLAAPRAPPQLAAIRSPCPPRRPRRATEACSAESNAGGHLQPANISVRLARLV